MNAPQYSVIRTLPVLFFLFLAQISLHPPSKAGKFPLVIILLSLENLLNCCSCSASCACQIYEYCLLTGNFREPTSEAAALWSPMLYSLSNWQRR